MNAATILVGAVVFVLAALVSYKLYSDKKQHKSSCGCDCGSCSGACHLPPQDESK